MSETLETDDEPRPTERHTLATAERANEGELGEKHRAGSGTLATGEIRATVDEGEREDRYLWRVATLAGVLAIGGAIAVIAVPSAVPAPERPGIVRATRSLALLLGSFVGLAGVYAIYDRQARERVSIPTANIEAPVAAPERVDGGDRATVGAAIDERLDDLDRGEIDDDTRETALDGLRSDLREVAIRVLVDATDSSGEEARERVRSGSWTDDVRAAAFLGGPDAPPLPPSTRLRDWASGRPTRRQVEATVDAIARVAGGEQR